MNQHDAPKLLTAEELEELRITAEHPTRPVPHRLAKKAVQHILAQQAQLEQAQG